MSSDVLPAPKAQINVTHEMRPRQNGLALREVVTLHRTAGGAAVATFVGPWRQLVPVSQDDS